MELTKPLLFSVADCRDLQQSNSSTPTSTSFANTSSSISTPALTLSTLTRMSSTSTANAASMLSSTDIVSQARATLSLGGLQSFCSNLLEYTTSYQTQTTVMTTGATGATTIATSNVTPISTHTVSYPTVTVAVTPGVTATVETTEIQTSTRTEIATDLSTVSHAASGVPKLRARQADNMTAPELERLYAPSILSLACSDLLGQPSAAQTLVTTVASIIFQTSYATRRYVIFNSTAIMSKDSTISLSRHTFTTTVSPSTHHASRTKTLTTTLNVTETSTFLVTKTSSSTSVLYPIPYTLPPLTQTQPLTPRHKPSLPKSRLPSR